MMRKPILMIALVLALVTMACRAASMPVREVKTGPMQTETLKIPEPSADVVNLTIAFGAGELTVEPGAEDALVSGEAKYNMPELKPQTTTNGSEVRLQTGDMNFKGMPNFGNDLKNSWDLKISDKPMNLKIQAGAYQGRFDLGGLNLESLEVTDGAADVDVEFSKPNQTDMKVLRYETGASSVKLEKIGNASPKELIFHSGAGDYTLDFTGKIKNDLNVEIQSGISQVTIIVPEGVSARLVFKGGLSNVETHDGWQQNGNVYTVQGTGPTLKFNVDMGAGNLNLKVE